MFLLECPNCGKRNVAEYRFGGEARPRPKNGDALPPEDWARFLYMRANKRGLQREWWYHRAGCQKWFLAERDTLTHEVQATYFYGQNQPAAPQSPPPAAENPPATGTAKSAPSEP